MLWEYRMRVKDIFPQCKIEQGIADLHITGICDDTRLVKKGDMFFMRRGNNSDIFPLLPQIKKKAVVLVAQTGCRNKLQNISMPVVLVRDVEKEFFRCADCFYDFDKNYFKFIGITGTNGKTTIAYLIYYLLNKLGLKASLIGTVKHLIANKVYKACNTTPGYLTLRKYLKEMKEEGIKFVVMEVSSHAIAQERIRGINFYRCVFTNLSRDHLDYHKTMTNYFKVKKKFFIDNKKAVSVINKDDVYGRKILGQTSNYLSYAIRQKADIQAQDVFLLPQGTRFDCRYKGKNFPVKTNLLGEYNILNVMAAMGVIFSMGVSPENILRFVSSFCPVDGRMNRIADNIFVDYAHTPDALKKNLLTLKGIGYEKIICVFGCGGNRDMSKRKIMGRISCDYADFTFITSDNPRSEDPAGISSQIEKGFRKNNYSIILDRKKAIEKAIGLSKAQEYKNCAVLVAGKGHEDMQICGKVKIPFKDSRVIKQLIQT